MYLFFYGLRLQQEDAMDQKTKIHSELRKNEFYIREKFENCADILIRPMRLGSESKIDCLMVYIEVAVSNMMLDDSALGKMINHFWEISPGQIQEFMRNNSLGIADVQKLADMEEVLSAVFAGNAVFFIDGYDREMKISSKGYPNMGVSEAESEKVLRGSKEGFSDSVKTNSALVRKRIRDSRMKVEEKTTGVRSKTVLQLLYMEDLVQEDLLENIKTSLDEYRIDGIFDSGILEMASFLRALRYLALLVATLLPGLYLAVIRFHTQILPANLILSFAKAREGVPFSSVVELIFLELSFELIREAGVRVPGALGNAIGIVGGLIIGDAAVSANLVSPIVVMIVALTALGSMVIPEEEFAAAFRLLKYVFLFLGGYLGIFGIVLGIYLTVAHLSGLLSFGMPYLLPFIKKEPCRDAGEGILRIPFRKRWQRPLYARWEQKVRLRKNDSDDSGESRREDSGKVQEQEEKDS